MDQKSRVDFWIAMTCLGIGMLVLLALIVSN